MIELIPAIDIIGGKCVRLCRGEYSSKKEYDGSPVELVRAYRDLGVRRVHLVDLDGAKASEPANLKVLEEAATCCPGLEMEWGGGIKSEQSLRDVFSAGASHAIVGSIAALNPDLMQDWLERFGASVILGADVRDGKIAVKGWLETAQTGAEELIGRFGGLREAVVTEISRDGMLQGPDFALYKSLQARFPQVSITVSGGISSMKDIERLDAEGLRKVIIGKAIYENRITREEISAWLQRG